ncbi:hypothetical protein E1A91_D10G057500v1 [Gossypium mustelinum]|uniref:E2 ubiquitin-conjugating enzyme n=3 Tax=Gossypium TaxID=3633 RepID=A0A5D2T4Y5_GOSMU|nr:hypothetical protein E1A91_D10G057500v1 [Gossypium mustelinum]
MAEKSCIKRLQKEYRALCKEPVSHVVARPSPSDILEWHYVLEGSEGTPFAGGYYYGKIKFPPEYPYKPPGITMITPNGRFMTQKKICLSMSDFHPESWNPMWSVSSILTGLLSFMMDNSPTTGSVNTTAAEKQRLAKTSLSFNCKNPTFRKLFPEYVDRYKKQQQLISEHSSPESPQGENSKPKTEKLVDSSGEDVRKVIPRRKQPFPTWMMLLLVSVFGIETMNKSPAHQQYETSDCSYEFDPQVNFSQFLEEARQHARDINLQRSSSCSEEVGKKRLGAEKKSKKSWRISLFSWWKINGKSKPGSDPVHVPNPSKPTKGYGSGPLCTTTRGIKTRHQRPSSGPVSILFTPTRKMENEVPYMSLDQPNDPYHINTYGPVYLVT